MKKVIFLISVLTSMYSLYALEMKKIIVPEEGAVPSLLYLAVQEVSKQSPSVFVEQLLDAKHNDNLNNLRQGHRQYKNTPLNPKDFVHQFASIDKAFSFDDDFITFINTKIRREPDKLRRALLKQCVMPLAVQTRSYACIRRLLHYKYPVNVSHDISLTCLEDQLCPTILSAAARNFSVYSLLCHAGADIHVRDTSGNNVLSYAVRGKNVQAVCQLVTKYPYMLHTFNHDNVSPLYEVVRCLPVHIVKKCIEVAVHNRGNMHDIRTYYTERNRHFMHAATCNRDKKRVIPLLIDYGILVDETTQQEVTPLMAALARSNFDVAQVLLQSGADIHKKRFGGESVLEYALLHVADDHQSEHRKRYAICDFLQRMDISLTAQDISLDVLERMILASCLVKSEKSALATIKYLLDIYMQHHRSCPISSFIWDRLEQYDHEELIDLLQSYGIYNPHVTCLAGIIRLIASFFMGYS